MQPSPVNPATQTIRVLEEALEAVTAYEQSQEQETATDSNDILQKLLDKLTQRISENWIDYYKPSPIINKALKQQNSNIQEEFMN